MKSGRDEWTWAECWQFTSELKSVEKSEWKLVHDSRFSSDFNKQLNLSWLYPHGFCYRHRTGITDKIIVVFWIIIGNLWFSLFQRFELTWLNDIVMIFSFFIYIELWKWTNSHRVSQGNFSSLLIIIRWG